MSDSEDDNSEVEHIQFSYICAEEARVDLKKAAKIQINSSLEVLLITKAYCQSFARLF